MKKSIKTLFQKSVNLRDTIIQLKGINSIGTEKAKSQIIKQYGKC